jgi:hypothetical protein
MTTNSVQNGLSRYVHGGATEVANNRIEWWDRAIFRQDPTDQPYVVEKFYEGRIDLIASVFYNEPRLWWLLAQFNNILDPLTEVTAGRVLLIPAKSRIDMMLSGKKGGYQSQRELVPTVPPVVV